jgi:hypothetical protein
MIPMVSRVIAGVLVLVLVGPSVVAATCELTCAMARHHHDAPAPSAASCHEHRDSSDDVGVSATPSTLCHNSVDLLSAVVDARPTSVVVHAAIAAPLVVGPVVTATPIVRSPEGRTPSEPRPPHRPLRV